MGKNKKNKRQEYELRLLPKNDPDAIKRRELEKSKPENIRRDNEQMKEQIKMNRMNTSESINQMVTFCEDNKKIDPFLNSRLAKKSQIRTWIFEPPKWCSIM